MGGVTMKKKILAGIMTVTLLAGADITQAAIPVIDSQNILKTVAIVENTISQIKNQLLELEPLDDSILNNGRSNVNTQISEMQGVQGRAQGLLNQTRSVEQAWQNTFGSIDTLFSSPATVTPTAQIANTRNTANVLDQTYQDAYRTAVQAGNLDKDWQNLQTLMDANQNAAGNKQSLQVQNSLIAQQNLLLLKQSQMLSAISSVLAASSAAQNQVDAQTTAGNQQIIEKIEAHQAQGDPLSSRSRGLL